MMVLQRRSLAVQPAPGRPRPRAAPYVSQQAVKGAPPSGGRGRAAQNHAPTDQRKAAAAGHRRQQRVQRQPACARGGHAAQQPARLQRAARRRAQRLPCQLAHARGAESRLWGGRLLASWPGLRARLGSGGVLGRGGGGRGGGRLVAAVQLRFSALPPGARMGLSPVPAERVRRMERRPQHAPAHARTGLRTAAALPHSGASGRAAAGRPARAHLPARASDLLRAARDAQALAALAASVVRSHVQVGLVILREARHLDLPRAQSDVAA